MIDDSHRQAEDEQEEKLERRPRVQLRKLAWPKFNSPMTEKPRASLLPPDIGRKWRNRVRH
jgi:hypothetical protein